MKPIRVFVLLLVFLSTTSMTFAATLTKPVIFVKQKKVDHSGGTIQDLFGNFQGAKPAADQPVGGGLYLLTTTGEVRSLVTGSNIAVRDPEVSEDATRVIFAYEARRRWKVANLGMQCRWHWSAQNQPERETQ